MKNLILLLALLHFASCKSNNQATTKAEKPEYADLNLSSVAKLFKGSTVKDGELLWKPEKSEQKAFENHISSDQFCHTHIDTVMKLHDKSYVIFHTTKYEGGVRSDFHAYAPLTGIASFEKSGNGYKLIKFKKDVFELGGYGEADNVTFDKLGSDVFKVSGGWTGMGNVLGYEQYFSCEDFHKIYEFMPYFSNEGMYEEGEPGYSRTERSIVKKSPSSIEVETIEVNYDEEGVLHETKNTETVQIY